MEASELTTGYLLDLRNYGTRPILETMLTALLVHKRTLTHGGDHDIEEDGAEFLSHAIEGIEEILRMDS